MDIHGASSRFLVMLSIMAMLVLGPALAEARGTKTAPGAEAMQGGQSKPRAAAKPKSRDEAEMLAKLEKLGPLLRELGAEAALVTGGKSDGVFLYAEMKGKQASLLLFRDRGKTVKWFLATPRLRELVEQAWSLELEGERWSIMTCEGNGKEFHARLLYPEEIDAKLSVDERVIALMPKRFDGKKLVVDRKSLGADAPHGDGPGLDEAIPVSSDESWKRT